MSRSIFCKAPLGLGILLFLFISGSAPAPVFEKETVLHELVYSSLRYGHLDPKPIDDEFSKTVYKNFLDRLDNQKRFFIQSDIDALEKYRLEIDTLIKLNSYAFLDETIQILESRIKEAEEYYKKELDGPIDFSDVDSIESDRKKIEYAQTKKELEKRWKKNLKYSTLARTYSLSESNNKKADSLQRSFSELEEKARKKVYENHEEWFNRLFKQEREDWLASYLDVIAKIYDPHTGYFPPKDKEDFDIEMSGRLEGIGARLSQKGDYIKVADIVAGSACWRQGELEIGDLIIEVAQADEEPTDVVGMRVDHAVKLIRGKKGTEVRLTVKKVDESIKTIAIIRDVVQLEQTYAKSVLLENQNTKAPIGYIYLPKFYSNFNSSNGRTSAGDVRKEVEKLKGDGVEKIIIDLRNNGGGSLQDVVKMAGLFVDKGPIVQVKDRYSPPYILRDEEEGVVFDGGLVILTNYFSASASEILAAALQDYDRALIIGSSSTYGKGTVQRFVDLDREMDRRSQGRHGYLKPLGSLKLTIQKFYRVDGKSTQLKGVTPDIILPDNYQKIEVGEKDYENALRWDEINTTNFERLEVGISDEVKPLTDHSRKRVDSDPYFKEVNNNADYLKTAKTKTMIPLNFDAYVSWQKEKKKSSKKLKEVSKTIEDLVITPPSIDKTRMETDSVFEARREKWFKALKKDHHLYEALNITSEMVVKGH